MHSVPQISRLSITATCPAQTPKKLFSWMTQACAEYDTKLCHEWNMTRVCAPVDDTVLAQIDKEVEEKGISRAQWVNIAISTYLTQDDTKLEQLKRDLTQAVSDREQTWRESTQLRQEKEHLSAELEHSRHKVVSLEASVADIERHKEEHRRHIEELERLKVTYEKTLEAMKLKDDEISFLRGHVSQLTQSVSQFALKPGEEEIKKKGWWQFWR